MSSGRQKRPKRLINYTLTRMEPSVSSLFPHLLLRTTAPEGVGTNSASPLSSLEKMMGVSISGPTHLRSSGMSWALTQTLSPLLTPLLIPLTEQKSGYRFSTFYLNDSSIYSMFITVKIVRGDKSHAVNGHN